MESTLSDAHSQYAYSTLSRCLGTVPHQKHNNKGSCLGTAHIDRAGREEAIGKAIIIFDRMAVAYEFIKQ